MISINAFVIPTSNPLFHILEGELKPLMDKGI